MGIVNLFADVTYEGGGAIAGPFLGSLGANALTVSVVAGLGEFLGYALRLGAGYAADRTGRHWPLTFIGDAINMLAVPALAPAGSWPMAERAGRRSDAARQTQFGLRFILCRLWLRLAVGEHCGRIPLSTLACGTRAVRLAGSTFVDSAVHLRRLRRQANSAKLSWRLTDLPDRFPITAEVLRRVEGVATEESGKPYRSRS